MKRTCILLFAALITGIGANAQKLVYESSLQCFGYQNDNGTWKIAPTFQRAGEFEGNTRKWAPVKIDGRWGCIDVDGNLICRNLHVFPSFDILGHIFKGRLVFGKEYLESFLVCLLFDLLQLVEYDVF